VDLPDGVEEHEVGACQRGLELKFLNDTSLLFFDFLQLWNLQDKVDSVLFMILFDFINLIFLS
jgi:hypothetical protein